MTTQHSLLGASGAHRWLNCPGSFHLSKTAPHRPSSIWAATGTAAHELIEGAVQQGLTEIDQVLTSNTIEIEGHEVTVDQTLINGVNVMLAYINRNYNWRGVEFQVCLDAYFDTHGYGDRRPPVSLYGTLDAGLLDISTETLEIVDYKNGAGVAVTPTENPQLLFYAAGAYQHLTPAARDCVKNVKLTIVQPNAPGLEPIRSWETSLVDVLMWVDEILVPGVYACAQPDAPLVTGEWCKFCPVSHVCPALHQAAVEMAKRDFGDASTVPFNGQPLADALDLAEKAQLYVERLQSFAVYQLQNGVNVPGWGLVPTRPSRKWLYPEDDVQRELEEIFDIAGIPPDPIIESRVRSPAQLEKALRGYRHGRRLFEETITPALVERVSTGVKLGRSNVPDAKGEFDVEE